MFEIIRETVAMVFIAGGFFFLMVGSIGLVRLPDVYNRMHAVGKCDTLGNGLMLVGLMLLMANFSAVVKLALMAALVVTINPVVTHMIAKTAYERGMEMVEGSFVLNSYSSIREEERRRDERRGVF